MPGTGIYFFFCSGFLAASGALVATGAGVGLVPTGILVLLLVLGLDIITKDCGWRWAKCRRSGEKDTCWC
jgi:hypothetical protein